MEELQSVKDVKEKLSKKVEIKFISIGFIVLLSLCFSFNLCVFAPLESYLANISEFWFSLVSFLPFIILVFLIIAALIFLTVFLLPKKLKLIAISLVFSATVGLYIQGNFLTKGYPSLNGEAIPWGQMYGKGIINTIIWIVVFALPIVIMFFKKDVFKSAIKFASIVIIGLEIVTLSTMLFTTDLSKNTPNVDKIYFSTENQFNFSKKENIIMIVSDTFESNYLERALTEFPELKKDLTDFTYYPDTTGVSTMSYLSMATLMTGSIYPTKGDLYDGMNTCYEDTSFFSSMHKNKFDVNYYTDSAYVSKKLFKNVDNVKSERVSTNVKSIKRVTTLLYKFSFFKYAPHFVKPIFVIDTAEFGKAQEDSGYPTYVFDDKKFLAQSKTQMKSDAKKRQYSLFHLAGIHAPHNADRNLEFIEHDHNVSYNDRRYEQSLGQIKILKEFIQQLKDKNLYDNTTLIYTADHGHQNRFNPVFMIKPKDEHSEFKQSTAPISQVADLIPFIRDLASGKGKDSEIYTVDSNMPRERFVYNYIGKNFDYAKENIVRSKISVNGKANDINSYQILSDDFVPSDRTPTNYDLGDEIQFASSPKNAITYGAFKNGEPYSKTVIIETSLKKPTTNDLIAKLKINKVFGERQRLIIQMDGTDVFNQTIEKGANQISFSIPNSKIKDGKIHLTMYCVDALRNTSDNDSLEWTRFNSFSFDSLSIS